MAGDTRERSLGLSGLIVLPIVARSLCSVRRTQYLWMSQLPGRLTLKLLYSLGHGLGLKVLEFQMMERNMAALQLAAGVGACVLGARVLRLRRGADAVRRASSW